MTTYVSKGAVPHPMKLRMGSAYELGSRRPSIAAYLIHISNQNGNPANGENRLADVPIDQISTREEWGRRLPPLKRFEVRR